ncbi:MAG: hypothetical protein WBB18_00910, partial [Nodosilinea sp.]
MIGSQSTAKTVFLLASMVGWLTVGAAMMYLFPAIADGVVGSEVTHLWMTNLARSGYNPALGWVGGGAALAVTVAGNWVWYRQVED